MKRLIRKLAEISDKLVEKSSKKSWSTKIDKYSRNPLDYVCEGEKRRWNGSDEDSDDGHERN